MNACEKTCVYVWRGNRNLQKVQLSAGFGFSGWLKATPAAASDERRVRDGLGTGSLLDYWYGRAHFRKVQISWQAQHFGKVGHRFHGRCTFARSSADFVTGTAFSYFWHGRIANPIGTDAQGGACRFRGRGSIFARSGTDFVAGAELSQGQVHNSWQVQHFRKVKCKIRGRRITFARSSTGFVAGAALSRGQVQISWQAQHFCKVNFRSRGSKIANFQCESSKRLHRGFVLQDMNFHTYVAYIEVTRNSRGKLGECFWLDARYVKATTCWQRLARCMVVPRVVGAACSRMDVGDGEDNARYKLTLFGLTRCPGVGACADPVSLSAAYLFARSSSATLGREKEQLRFGPAWRAELEVSADEAERKIQLSKKLPTLVDCTAFRCLESKEQPWCHILVRQVLYHGHNKKQHAGAQNFCQLVATVKRFDAVCRGAVASCRVCGA